MQDSRFLVKTLVIYVFVMLISSLSLAQHFREKTGDVSDIVFSRLFFDVNPASRFISGEVTHHFLISNSSDTLCLQLSDSLVVDSLLYHGVAVEVLRPGSGMLLIPLSASVAGGLDSVTIVYHGTPPDNGRGYFETDYHNSVPVMWTLSEPYGASDWWPCQNTLIDKIDSLHLSVRCPVGNKVASNGLLRRVEEAGNHQVWHWRHRYPIADYLVAFAVTNYSYYEERIPVGLDTIFVANYVYPEDSADRVVRTGWIHQAYVLFSDLFGPYPFLDEKYGHAEMNRGGGMEHQTMTFLGSFDYEVMVHELAHQWFGDAITCGSWFDLWLNEGWATYCSALAYERLQGGVFWKPWKDFWRSYITSEPDGVVQTTDTLDVPRLFDSRLTYGKAAYTLHMLRWVMSDSLFYEATRQYLNNPQLYMKFARTNDFRAHMEDVYGRDLETFFWQWLQGEGYPTYKISWSQTSDTLTLVVNQETSHSSVGFFEMPLPITVLSGVEATPLRLENSVQNQVFQLIFPSPIDSIQFDSDQWLLSGNNQVTGVQSAENQRLFRFYPNPSSQKISVLSSDDGFLTISDLFGKPILQCKIKFGITHFVDIERLNAGFYLISFESPGFRTCSRLIKM
ncbi:MAG: M1 family aminopeptidase [Bacteroidales bacterium]|nr:M1 family aminopeptidase [Bacteroidales bacterium]MDD3664424.1 M1 family aminopeptidase [Bacteroidales bacterium]